MRAALSLEEVQVAIFLLGRVVENRACISSGQKGVMRMKQLGCVLKGKSPKFPKGTLCDWDWEV